MRTLCLVSTLSIGCAASAPVQPTTPHADPAAVERISELEAAVRDREQEIRELRSRLALVRAEAEELRAREHARRGETVRIRSDEADEDGLLFFEDEEDESSDGEWEVPQEDLPAEQVSEGPRPTLRLYGTPAVELPAAALRAPDLPPASLPPNPLASLPPATGGTWGATPVTSARALVYVPPSSAAPRGASRGPVVDAQYRAGLGALRDRRFEEALGAFDAFLRRAPSHPQAANARYWRAEVLYILRRYREARAAFEGYLAAHAAGRKAPDALYKLALCHRRLGDEAGARRALERLRRTSPNSVAARTASREAS